MQARQESKFRKPCFMQQCTCHARMSPSIIHHYPSKPQNCSHAALQLTIRLEVTACCHAYRSQAVNLIEEDDGGLAALCFCKQSSELPLRLPHPLGQNVCSLAHEEGHWPACPAGAGCQGSGHQGLACACACVGVRVRVHGTCVGYVSVGGWSEEGERT